ncbi:MAG: hypothetical protein ACOC0Z_01155 [Halohasta sp.]
MIGRRRLLAALGHRPLQASKLIAVILGLLFGFVGTVRFLGAGRVVDGSVLADGEFLALVFVPVVGLAVIGIVSVETLHAGYRVLRAERSIQLQASGRVGYVLIRGIEAATAVVGLAVIAELAPRLFAYAMPAPTGVGPLFGLTGVGTAVLVASLVRSAAELWYF